MNVLSASSSTHSDKKRPSPSLSPLLPVQSLQSTNTSSLPITTNTTTVCEKPAPPMTISMSFSNKGAGLIGLPSPLDLSHVTTPNTTECPKLMKAEEEEEEVGVVGITECTQSSPNPPNLASGENHQVSPGAYHSPCSPASLHSITTHSSCLLMEDKKMSEIFTKKSEAEKSEDASSQLKVLVDLIKTLASPTTANNVVAPTEVVTTSTLDVASSLLALFGKNKNETKIETVSVPTTATEPLNVPGSRDLLFQLGQQLMTLAASGGTTQSSQTIHPEMMLQSNFNEISSSMWQPPVPTSVNRQSRPIDKNAASLSGISMRGNQKYSAFYQHHRKQTLTDKSDATNSDAFLRGQTSTPFAHRLAGALNLSNRRCSNITNSSNNNNTTNVAPVSTSANSRFSIPPVHENSLIKSSCRIPFVSPETSLSGNLSSISTHTRSRETAFVCSCGEDFDSLYVFTLHMKDTGHKPKNSQPERDIPKLVRGQDMWINSETEQTREILRCMRCNQSFRSLPELTMHMMKTSHYSEIVYSDAGRNVLASQSLSSVSDINRSDRAKFATSGVIASASSHWFTSKYTSTGSLKRGSRISSGGCGNLLRPTTPNGKGAKTPDNLSNGHRSVSPQQVSPTKLFKVDATKNEPCQRPASSHELQAKTPKSAVSPEAFSCPSTLQRSEDGDYPMKDIEKHDICKSPSSSRGTASPACHDEKTQGEGHKENNYTDSVIRQIESFVEKSLPYPSISSPLKSNWQRHTPTMSRCGSAFCNIFQRPNQSPLGSHYDTASIETSHSSSISEKNGQRKRRYSSGSSVNTAAPQTETGVDKLQSISFHDNIIDNGMLPSSTLENPLSSLQKLVETTHQVTNIKSLGSSPLHSFNQTNESLHKLDIPSPSVSNHSNEIDSVKQQQHQQQITSSPQQQQSQPPNLASALSALYSYMSKSSSFAAPKHADSQPEVNLSLDLKILSELSSLKSTEQEIGKELVDNKLHQLPKDLPPAFVGLLTAVLNIAKQSNNLSSSPNETELHKSESDLATINSISNSILPSTAFNSFTNSNPLLSGFDLQHSNYQQGRHRQNIPTSLVLPVHMSTGGPNVIANITKKAKCHFCGKPFANKGQVRLHISKNKCPCLLQQSCHAAAMAKVYDNNKSAPSPMLRGYSSSSFSSKRPVQYAPSSYQGFPGGDFSQLFGVRGQRSPGSGMPMPPVQRSHSSVISPPKQNEGINQTEAALEMLLRHIQGRQAPVTTTQSTATTFPTNNNNMKSAELLASLARVAAAGGSNNSLLDAMSLVNNPLLSLFSPPPPPPPTTAPDAGGLTPEQKALFLFAQAMSSLSKPAAITEEAPKPTNPLANLLQNFNLPNSAAAGFFGGLPQATQPPLQSQPATTSADCLASMNPEILGSYLNAIRKIASLGGLPPVTSSSLPTTSSSSSTTVTTSQERDSH